MKVTAKTWTVKVSRQDRLQALRSFSDNSPVQVKMTAQQRQAVAESRAVNRHAERESARHLASLGGSDSEASAPQRR